MSDKCLHPSGATRPDSRREIPHKKWIDILRLSVFRWALPRSAGRSVRVPALALTSAPGECSWSPVMTTLLERIRTREAKVVVVGAGYVGLPLAVEVAKAGFKVTAYDKSVDKVQSLGRGVSYVNDVSSETLAPLVEAGTLDASADPDVLCGGGRRHHLRPHAAQQDQGSGQLVHHGRGGDAGAADEAAAAGRPREHHLPRLHPRGAAPPVRAGRPQARRRLLPGLLPGAGRSREPEVLHPQHPQGAGRHLAEEPRGGAGDVRPLHRDDRPGVVDRQRRDGQAAGEHLPRRQHRPRQRGGDHVRRASASTPGR